MYRRLLPGSRAPKARVAAVAAPSQRRALGALFLVLALGIAGIAWAAYKADQWIIAAAAGAIALWLAGMTVWAFRS